MPSLVRLLDDDACAIDNSMMAVRVYRRRIQFGRQYVSKTVTD